MSSILEVVTSITLLFNSFRQVKNLTQKSSISQRELDELAKTMPSIVDSVFRNRSQRLTKIAQPEVFNMPLIFQQLWDQFHEIFGRMWTKLHADQLRARPYIRPSKRPKRKKSAVRSPGTDCGSYIDMDRLNLRSPEPRSLIAPPRNGFPDAPGPAPAPKPTTKVNPKTEAILSERAIAKLRIRPRAGEAQLPPGITFSGHNFGSLEIRSRPLPPPGPPPPPAAGAKRGRGDDNDDEQPDLPATKRQLRPTQVFPPQRFVRPPGATAHAGSSSSPAASAVPVLFGLTLSLLVLPSLVIPFTVLKTRSPVAVVLVAHQAPAPVKEMSPKTETKTKTTSYSLNHLSTAPKMT